MRTGTYLLLTLYTLLFLAGCSSSRITEHQIFLKERIPRPAHIWVYDFAATAADIPAESVLSGQDFQHPESQTAEQIEKGRKAGAAVASELVTEIRAMGMPAERASQGTTQEINDIVIRGYILAIDEGNAAKRVAIGFGSGASELKVAVEGFQVTAQGLRKIGAGKMDSGGSKSPGSAMGVATLIATANPVGLIVSTGVKVYGETSGSSKTEGRAKQAAKEIAEQMKVRFKKAGWI
jgi:Domain of unknown function (DUF4410)